MAHHRNMDSISDANDGKLHSKTWNRLILTKLGFDSKLTSTADILDIQTNDWGGLTADNLLVELFPLPSPGVKDWKYSSWVDLNSELYFLENRALYKATVVNKRIAYIKNKIKEHQPQFILFYGKSMQPYWDEIIGETEFHDETILERYHIRYFKNKNTLFVQCPQPTYIRGYAFWIELGKEIKRLSNL